jgi:anti-sigma regulatory factor (Ser/Thr protein kinase)
VPGAGLAAVNGAGLTGLMSHVLARVTAPEPARSAAFAGVRESAGAARRLVAGTLAGCPRVDDLVTAVSELATNAILHSASGEGGAFTVTIRTAPRWARVEVTDAGPPARPGGVSNGRGLVVVRGVADRAGHSIAPDGARTGWAEVTWPP